MFRKSFLSLLLIAFLSVFFLMEISSSVYAGNRNKAIGLRSAATMAHRCDVPYNINIAGYSTGLHIVADWIYDLEFEVIFYSGSEPYYKTNLTVPPAGWTGMVTDLLPKNVPLKFPTLLLIYSYKDQVHNDGTDNENFWVTQFLFTNFGFSHQTFFSYPVGDVLY